MLSTARGDDACSEAGSIGSVGEAAASAAVASPLDPDYLRLQAEEAEDADADDLRGDSGWGDLDLDIVGWRPTNYAATDFSNAVNDAADNATAVFDPTTRQRRGRGDRSDLGLGANGRVMYCDYHDHRCEDAGACMAVDMLQQRDVAALVERHRKVRRDKPRDDPDGRRARHALYKAVVAWQWANPLGAENRVRLPVYVCCIMCAVGSRTRAAVWTVVLPVCVLHRVRRLFPNPCCRVDGCDFLVQCERARHYTGFRTAEESRAIREGHFVGVDLRCEDSDET
jgi:hypothetical protein